MEGCKQREAAAAALEVGAVAGVGGGCQGNGYSPNSPGNWLRCHCASWWSCSGASGWRSGTEGCSEAKERVAWIELFLKVCLLFQFCLFQT